ncbi:MAG: MBL fold metallo-hydrolase [Planctomycetota bacterium]
MPMQLVFLGTGTSAGVPMIGCGCAVCDSDDPRDRRDRASVLVTYPDVGVDLEPHHADYNPEQAGRRQMLIDAGPEMRQQVIRHRLSRIDALWLTHAHADHTFGIDDLRRFNATMKRPIDVYAEPDVLDQCRRTFRHIFAPQHNANRSFVAQLVGQAVTPGGGVERYGATWTPLRLLHGRLPIVGYRVDFNHASLAYCTDVSSIPPETFPLLRDLDVLVIDALRYRHHPTHLTVDQALTLIEQIGPRRAYLTHIAHDIRHAELEPQLPDGVAIAYDGLAVDVGAISAPPPTARADTSAAGRGI